MPAEPLVTIALPVYNGAGTIERVARSVLSQDYSNIELVIADNASADDTQEICRELARTDARVRYHRQPRNVGLLNNFIWLKHNSRGSYLRWIGDNDEIYADYVSRCLACFERDERLILVTTGIEYVIESGEVESAEFEPTAQFASDDPITRLSAMIDLLTRSYLLLDPIYGMAKTAAVRDIVQDNILRGDEVYAAKLALAGPWGHITQVLAQRDWNLTRPKQAATLLDVPMWHSRMSHLIETRHLLASIDEAPLTAAQRRRARGIVMRHYVRRHRAKVERGVRKARTRFGSS